MEGLISEVVIVELVGEDIEPDDRHRVVPRKSFVVARRHRLARMVF